MDFNTFNIQTLLLPCVVAATAMVVVFTELIKRLDKKDRLKGHRVYIPAALSLVFSAAMAFGEFYAWKQCPFYWAVLFGLSVFNYEGWLKRLQAHEEKTGAEKTGGGKADER